MQDLRRYIQDKLRSRNTYIVALIFGTFINGYGHFLVPTLRGETEPLSRFLAELAQSPGLVICSIVLAYVFPMCVGVYSSVATRFATRPIERRSWFPDHKPDPVFRATSDGKICDWGSQTGVFFEEHGVSKAQDVLGDDTWTQVMASDRTHDEPLTVRFPPTRRNYSVVTSPAPNGDINVYMTRQPEAVTV